MIIKCKYCHSEIGYHVPPYQYMSCPNDVYGGLGFNSVCKNTSYVCLECNVDFIYRSDDFIASLIFIRIHMNSLDTISINIYDRKISLESITNGFITNLPYELSNESLKDIKKRANKILIFS